MKRPTSSGVSQADAECRECGQVKRAFVDRHGENLWLCRCDALPEEWLSGQLVTDFDTLCERTQGRRLPDNDWLSRAADGLIEPGDYGRCLIKHPQQGGTSRETVYGESWEWFVCCPDGSTTKLWVNEDDRNGHRHILTEHDDSSITVGGSIMGGEVVPVVALVGEIKASGEFWHGYLRHGVWESL